MDFALKFARLTINLAFESDNADHDGDHMPSLIKLLTQKHHILLNFGNQNLNRSKLSIRKEIFWERFRGLTAYCSRTSSLVSSDRH